MSMPASLTNRVQAARRSRSPRPHGGEDEGVDDIAALQTFSLGVGPSWRAVRDGRRLGKTPEEPGTWRRPRNLFRHLRSQGRRYLSHVVLLATEEKHCAGRKQG